MGEDAEVPSDDGGGLVADAVGLGGLGKLSELREEAVESEGLAEEFEGLEAEVFGGGMFGEVQEDGEDLLDVELSGVLGDGLLGVHGGMVSELVCGWQVGVGGGGGVRGAWSGRCLVLVTARYPRRGAGMTQSGCGYDGGGDAGMTERRRVGRRYSGRSISVLRSQRSTLAFAGR